MGSFLDIDAWLAAVLVDAPGPAAAPFPCSLDEGLLHERIVFHAIAPLLFSRLDPACGWPVAITAQIREEAMLQALWEPSHKAAVQGALESLHKARVEALVMKGTALAYSAYRAAQFRRRGDSDLLVRGADLDAARQALAQAGWQRLAPPVGLTHAECWNKAGEAGFTHTIDLHWQVRSAPALRRLLRVEECFSRSVALPALGEAARAPDHVLTFLQCSINQAWHATYGLAGQRPAKPEGHRLIWVYDHYLMCQGFDARQWHELVDIARTRGIGAIVRRSLELARDLLAAPVPEAVLSELAEETEDSVAARYLLNPNRISRLRCNYAALENSQERISYLASLLVPGRAQLEQRYPEAAGRSLAALHWRRLTQVASLVQTSRLQ